MNQNPRSQNLTKKSSKLYLRNYLARPEPGSPQCRAWSHQQKPKEPIQELIGGLRVLLVSPRSEGRYEPDNPLRRDGPPREVEERG